MDCSMTKLTDYQESFVANYINNGGDVRNACLSAGYSESFASSRAYHLLKVPAIKDLIDQANEDLLTRLKVTLADKVKKLRAIIDDVLPENGEPKREYYKDALKAIEQLNKMSGHYMPEKRVSFTVDATKDKLKDIRKQYEEY